MLRAQSYTMSVSLTAILLISAACLIGCGNQRQSGGSTDAKQCEAIIPEDALPPGWRMMNSSEMPPIDKTPWWHQNPQLLKGRETTEVLDWPKNASQVWAVIYENNEARERIVIFCYTYPTANEASAPYRHWQSRYSSEDTLLGFSRKEKNTIVFMTVPAKCPDRDFFVRHFAAVACPPEDPRS